MYTGDLKKMKEILKTVLNFGFALLLTFIIARIIEKIAKILKL